MMANKVNVAVLPSLDHFSLADYGFFYEPSDDTFLLCDAIQTDRLVIGSRGPLIALEVGSGSGCVITFLTKMLMGDGIIVQSMATDLNPHATLATARTAAANNVRQAMNDIGTGNEYSPPSEYISELLLHVERNRLKSLMHLLNSWLMLLPMHTLLLYVPQVHVDIINCHLVSGLSSDCIDHSVDVLVFNPPYVPTPPEEVGQGD